MQYPMLNPRLHQVQNLRYTAIAFFGFKFSAPGYPRPLH